MAWFQLSLFIFVKKNNLANNFFFDYVKKRINLEEKPELKKCFFDNSVKMKSPIPISRVEFLYMYAMNFKEFLVTINQKKLASYIEEFNFSIPFSEVIHCQISQYLRFYFFIGGMPAVVKTYTEKIKLSEIQRIYNNMLTSIQYDFAKYGTRKHLDVKGSDYYSPGGKGEKTGFPIKVESNPASHNMEDAKKLREESEKLTGVNFDF